MSRRTSTIRRSLAALAVAAGAATALVGPASPAAAIPACKSGYQCTYLYFSSASYETIIGGRTNFCDGTSDSFGTTSRWLEFSSAKCPDPL
ncbi:DUF6289 family protein [Micromonospora sp. NPDC050397]|uniref:DUF6289 family protein n=1 Tax=Micromonospora sp. NPDC050397 TaxID=3364279 RepID=UPI00385027AB